MAARGIGEGSSRNAHTLAGDGHCCVFNFDLRALAAAGSACRNHILLDAIRLRACEPRLVTRPRAS